MKGQGRDQLSAVTAVLIHHGGAQDFIDAGLISLPLGLEPGKDISIHSERERLLDGTVELTYDCSGPIANLREVGKVNVLLFHFFQAPQLFGSLFVDFAHIAFFRATLLFAPR